MENKETKISKAYLHGIVFINGTQLPTNLDPISGDSKMRGAELSTDGTFLKLKLKGTTALIPLANVINMVVANG
jgi:hypothetical protein